MLVRRKPTKTFDGLGRVEELAGVAIVPIILVSAVVAGYEAIDRLIHPHAVTALGLVAVAGVIGLSATRRPRWSRSAACRPGYGEKPHLAQRQAASDLASFALAFNRLNQPSARRGPGANGSE